MSTSCSFTSYIIFHRFCHLNVLHSSISLHVQCCFSSWDHHHLTYMTVTASHLVSQPPIIPFLNQLYTAPWAIFLKSQLLWVISSWSHEQRCLSVHCSEGSPSTSPHCDLSVPRSPGWTASSNLGTHVSHINLGFKHTVLFSPLLTNRSSLPGFLVLHWNGKHFIP